MNIIRVGVDIAKSVFHVHAIDRREKTCWQGKYSRTRWIDAVCKRVPEGTIIGMEACASAHYWGRLLQRKGYQVKLVAPQFVKPYVKSNKNDRIDAAAICEAISRPEMRFVSVKTTKQQDAQAAHRIREELIRQRTAKANQIRGLVGEYGLLAPIGIQQLRQAIPLWLEDVDNGLSDSFRLLLCSLSDDLRYFDERITQLNQQIEVASKTDPIAKRLLELRGIGPLIANALSVVLGADAENFRSGKDFAASLGLTPRQHSTGGKSRLLGISKRGDSYLRKLLVHGSRAVLCHLGNKEDKLSCWLRQMLERKHFNVVTVALANKTARAAWAMIKHDTHYDPELIAS